MAIAAPMATTDIPTVNGSVIMIISRLASGLAPATVTPNMELDYHRECDRTTRHVERRVSYAVIPGDVRLPELFPGLAPRLLP